MSTDFTEQWSNMQKMFLQSSEMSASFRENARQFWENQGKVLDNMQALANGWFDRRRTGTLSAREAAELVIRFIWRRRKWWPLSFRE